MERETATGLLNSGYVTLKFYPKEMACSSVVCIKYYARPYYANLYPIIYKSVSHYAFFKEMNDTPALYHLFFEGSLVYVGITNCLHKRLSEHDMDEKKEWDAYVHFSIHGLSIAEARKIERAVIERHNPILNTQWVNGIYNYHF